MKRTMLSHMPRKNSKTAQVLGFALAIALVWGAGMASAQPSCLLGVYADENGSGPFSDWLPIRDLGNPVINFDVYYILFVEDFVNAVAWNREIVNFPGSGVFSSGLDVIESGYGTFVSATPEGYRMGNGACKIGFGGVPIVVMRESLVWLSDFYGFGGQIAVAPNVLEDANNPVYNTCTNEILPCESGILNLNVVISNESQSWGQVKALYQGN